MYAKGGFFYGFCERIYDETGRQGIRRGYSVPGKCKAQSPPLCRVAERREYGYQRQTAVAVLFLYSKKRKESEDMKKMELKEK